MKTTRRQFLATSGGALTALACTTVPTGAAVKRWRVAVIGHTGRGNYGHGLDVMWLRVPRTEVVAVADADAAGLAATRKKLKDAPGFADYRTMLREARPEIVAVAPRHIDQHHAMCLAAIAAGARGLYVEKPFCRTPREADEILEACKERNVKLAVAHRALYHPVMPVLRRLLAAGEIGPVLELRTRGKEDHRGGALDLWVLGTHTLVLAAALAGPPAGCSGMLYQDGRPCRREDIRPGDEGVGAIAGNQVHARFEMAGGTPLFFDSIQNRGDKNAGLGLQLIGSTGIIDLRVDQEPQARIRRGNATNPETATQPWLPVTSAGIGRPEAVADLGERIATHEVAGEDLLAAIEQDRAPLCDASAGRTSIEMVCAVFESHQRGGARVALPLERRDHPFAKV